jgi:hypothetical protein
MKKIFVKESELRKYREVLEALLEGRTHPLPCECAACLYDVYRSPKSRRGHPHSKRLFYMNYLLHEVKLDSLEEAGRTKEVIIYGKKRRVIPIRRSEDLKLYDDASWYLKVHEILKRLRDTEIREEYVAFLRGLIRSKNYYHRVEGEEKDYPEAKRFRDLIGELIERRVKEYPDRYILSGIPPEHLERKKKRFYQRLSNIGMI